MCRARQCASSVSVNAVISSPPTRSSPLSGLSMPAMRLSSVLLPEPEGPMRAVNSPAPMSSEMSPSTGTVWPPRRYDLARCRISTMGCAAPKTAAGSASGGRYASLCTKRHLGAVVQPFRRPGDDLLAGLHPIADFDHVADLPADLHLRLDRLIAPHNVNDALSTALDDRRWLYDRAPLAQLRRQLLREKGDLGAHLRKHGRSLVYEAHLYRHGGFGAIDGRHHAPDDPAESSARQGIQLDLAGLLELDLAEARLGDVGFDLERGHVGHRHHCRLRTERRGKRRDD